MIAENALNEADEDRVDVNIDDDVEDQTLAIPRYSITSYGIDYDVAGLVRRLNDDDILIPGFQRDFVWSAALMSRFIESLLLGLPVPGIFLYRMDDDRYQVIDGQQRIKTLQAFYAGTINEKPFRLVRLDSTSEFEGLTYQKLIGTDRRRLDNSIIHATVIRQDKPTIMDQASTRFSRD